MSDKRLEIYVAGHIDTALFFEPGPSWCGNIRDGVTMWHGKDGCWVISYEDLERMYDAATEARIVSTMKENDTP